MNKAGWGVVLLIAALLCGLLNVAGAYADNGKVAMAILAALLFLISLALLLNKAQRTASQQETAIAPEQQYQPPHQQAQPPPQQSSSSGGVLFIPKPLPGDPFRREPEDDN